MDKYLWHCTRMEYLNRILTEGVRANYPEERPYKIRGVYLSTYQFNWMWNTTREGKFKGVTLKINITGLKLDDDYHIDKRDVNENSKRIGKDYICLSDIPPERIKEIWIETKPNSFQRLQFDILKPDSLVVLEKGEK